MGPCKLRSTAFVDLKSPWTRRWTVPSPPRCRKRRRRRYRRQTRRRLRIYPVLGETDEVVDYYYYYSVLLLLLFLLFLLLFFVLASRIRPLQTTRYYYYYYFLFSLAQNRTYFLCFWSSYRPVDLVALGLLGLLGSL